MKKIFLRDAGVINEKTNNKYFKKREFFNRLNNAIYLANKNSIGLQLTINKNFFLENIESFEKKKIELISVKALTIHLHSFYNSLISETKENIKFVNLLNRFFNKFKNLKGYCIHPDNVSNYKYLKKLKIKKRYMAIEVCDLKSKSGNNFLEISDLLKKNKFLDLVLDSSHIEQTREKYPLEPNTLQYFKAFKSRAVEIQLSSYINLYKKNIFTNKFKTDHCLLSLSDKNFFSELKKIKGLNKINLVIEGVVPFNKYGEKLLKKEIKLLNELS